MPLKGPIGEIAATPEVFEHLVEAVIPARNTVITGDDPGDVGREQVLESGALAAGVERVRAA